MFLLLLIYVFILFFNDTSTNEIYTYLHTLSLHDALPISSKRELRYAIVNFVERSRAFRSAELRIDPASRVTLAAMEEDYRFGRWTALRSKITTFHRRRTRQAGRIAAAVDRKSVV